MLWVLSGGASSSIDEALLMSTNNNDFHGEVRKQQPENSFYLGIPLSLLIMTPAIFLKEDVITSLLEI